MAAVKGIAGVPYPRGVRASHRLQSHRPTKKERNLAMPIHIAELAIILK
jgi:hypothetical protein